MSEVVDQKRRGNSVAVAPHCIAKIDRITYDLLPGLCQLVSGHDFQFRSTAWREVSLPPQQAERVAPAEARVSVNDGN